MSLLWTLSVFHSFYNVFIVYFEEVNVRWEKGLILSFKCDHIVYLICLFWKRGKNLRKKLVQYQSTPKIIIGVFYKTNALWV